MEVPCHSGTQKVRAKSFLNFKLLGATLPRKENILRLYKSPQEHPVAWSPHLQPSEVTTPNLGFHLLNPFPGCVMG